jgi:hypothetical protein
MQKMHTISEPAWPNQGFILKNKVKMHHFLFSIGFFQLKIEIKCIKKLKDYAKMSL